VIVPDHLVPPSRPSISGLPVLPTDTAVAK
jgi:hypothetical protein